MNDLMYAVVPENDPLAKEEEIPIEAFEDAPFIITEYTPGSDVHRILKKHKIHPDIRYVTRNEFSSLSMVEHELGYSILPGLLLRGQQGKICKTSIEANNYKTVRTCIFFSRKSVTCFKDFSGICKRLSVR